MVEVWLKSSEGQLSILGIAMACAMLFADAAWWTDVLASFRGHLGLAVLLGSVLALARKSWSVAVVDVLVAGFLLMPLSMEQTPKASGVTDLRLAIHNVHTANRDFAPALESMESTAPDVMAFFEVDEGWEQAIRHRFPSREIIASPRSDNFGIALVSRVPIAGMVFETPPIGVPSIDATVTTSGGPIRLILTHPVPPLSEEWWEARNTQLAAILRRVRDSEIPVVIAGDFNLTPTSPAWSQIVGSSGMRRAGWPVGTWPSWLGPVGLPSDPILTSPGLSRGAFAALPGSGSDHRGLVVGLRRSSD